MQTCLVRAGRELHRGLTQLLGSEPRSSHLLSTSWAETIGNLRVRGEFVGGDSLGKRPPRLSEGLAKLPWGTKRVPWEPRVSWT